MKEKHRRTVAADYFDYSAVKSIWLTLNSRDALEREHDKVWAAYEAWVPSFHANRGVALTALETHPQRDAIKRAYDIQLAYEHWLDHVYFAWRRRFYIAGGTYKFDELLAMRQDPTGKCFPKDSLPTRVSCGHLPDWRNSKHKEETKTLHEEHAASNARWRADMERDRRLEIEMRRILRQDDPNSALKEFLDRGRGK